MLHFFHHPSCQSSPSSIAAAVASAFAGVIFLLFLLLARQFQCRTHMTWPQTLLFATTVVGPAASRKPCPAHPKSEAAAAVGQSFLHFSKLATFLICACALVSCTHHHRPLCSITLRRLNVQLWCLDPRAPPNRTSTKLIRNMTTRKLNSCNCQIEFACAPA